MAQYMVLSWLSEKVKGNVMVWCYTNRREGNLLSKDPPPGVISGKSLPADRHMLSQKIITWVKTLAGQVLVKGDGGRMVLESLLLGPANLPSLEDKAA